MPEATKSVGTDKLMDAFASNNEKIESHNKRVKLSQEKAVATPKQHAGQAIIDASTANIGKPGLTIPFVMMLSTGEIVVRELKGVSPSAYDNAVMHFFNGDDSAEPKILSSIYASGADRGGHLGGWNIAHIVYIRIFRSTKAAESFAKSLKSE